MFDALLALAFLWPDPPPADEALSGTRHTGVYVELFETSLFEPCDSDERWWLDARGEINKPFWNRVKELRAEYERQSGEPLGTASPTYLLTAKGRVSESGEHGHLGQYERQFDLEEFSEFRLATAEERIRCLTSGLMPNGAEEKN